MTANEKNKFIERVENLLSDELYEEAAALLMTTDNAKDDYDIALLTVRTFINMADDEHSYFYDAAETLLMKFAPRGAGDHNWLYLMAQTLYFRDRCIEAVRYLELIFDGRDPESFPEAAEMLSTCRSFIQSDFQKYSEEQLRAVKDHIDAYFGEISGIIGDPDPLGIKIDIAVIDPDEFHDYYTLVTIGMGAYEMNVPEPFEKERLGRAELVIYLPSDSDPKSKDFAYEKILEHMRELARLPIERRTWVGYGHMISGGAPLDVNTKLCATLLINIQNVADESLRCFMPDGEDVVFYQLFPIYEEEMEYKLTHGIKDLMKKMKHISPVYDPVRENVCKNLKSGSAGLLRGELDMLKGLEIGRNCAASRRITEDGCKVGFMKRALFDGDSDLSENDSGWVFLAGTESNEYLSDPYHIELCSLNTVCNIDEDILPFIDMPYGTEVVRGYDGVLRVHELPPDSDDDSESLPS